MGALVLEDSTAREHVAQKPMPRTDVGSMAPCTRAALTQKEMHAQMSVVDCSYYASASFMKQSWNISSRGKQNRTHIVPRARLPRPNILRDRRLDLTVCIDNASPRATGPNIHAHVMFALGHYRVPAAVLRSLVNQLLNSAGRCRAIEHRNDTRQPHKMREKEG